MRNNRIYDNQFIQDAINLVETKGKSVSGVANSLKIPTTTLHQWIKKSQKNPDYYSSRPSKHTNAEMEILELKRQLADSNLERDILKKAVAIFSKPQK